MLISELPNTHTYPLRALAELRAKECDPNQIIERISGSFGWGHTRERVSFWGDVNEGQRPPIPAESIEDLRKAGMMPEPEPVIKDFARVDKPSFFCNDAEEIGVIKCKDQCAYCKDAEDTGSSIDTAAPPPFYCENSESTAGPCANQCAECAVDERAARKHNDALTNGTFVPPSITLSDYARMEREEEINELIQTMLTPEELRGYYMGNIIKYRMRAGKKAFTGEDQSDDLFNARNFEGLLAELERGEG